MQCRGECYWLAEVSLCLHSEVFSAPPYLMITSEGPALQRHPAVWGFYTLSHTDWQSKTRLGWTRQTADNQTFHYFADVSPDTDGMEYISNNKVFSVEDAIITRNNTARSNWEFVIGQGKDERLLTDPTIHVRWVYVKDVPNGQLRHIRLENNENKPVTNSRDTQEVPPEKGRQVLKIIHTYKHQASASHRFLLNLSHNNQKIS